jgi:hypothetical protein
VLVSEVQLERHAAGQLMRDFHDWRRHSTTLNGSGAGERRAKAGSIGLLSSNRSDFNAYFGVHAAGYGTWSARLWDFISRCVVPIIMTDGVILPFERHLNYELFSAKLLSSSHNAPARTPRRRSAGSLPPLAQDGSAMFLLERLRAAAQRSADSSRAKGGDASRVAHPGGSLGSADDDPLRSVITSLGRVAGWLDWRSADAHRNPFSLAMIELLCFTAHRHLSPAVQAMCKRSTTRVAMKAYLPPGI